MNAKSLIVSSYDLGTRVVDVEHASCAIDLLECVKIAFQVLGDVALFVCERPLPRSVVARNFGHVDTPAHRAVLMPVRYK
uniref:MC081R n=1 Tax=Rousettus bat poxvirus TaxID=3141933 RepID=A0AAU7E1F8_9POXV